MDTAHLVVIIGSLVVICTAIYVRSQYIPLLMLTQRQLSLQRVTRGRDIVSFSRLCLWMAAVTNLLGAVTPLRLAFVIHALLVVTCLWLIFMLRWPDTLIAREIELRARLDAPSES